MPIISVIVPVYKVEPFLNRCVDSILSQSYSDFELILVDDGSPDNSGKICDAYEKKDERVKVLHQENRGLSGARNAGIDWAFRNSDSQWISFIDSDDWVHYRYLEILYKAVQDADVLISGCGFCHMKKYEKMPREDYSARVIKWDEFYLQDTVVGTIAPCKLYAKSLFEGVRYPIGKLHEDEYVTYKLLYYARKIAWVERNLYYYYDNIEGITHSEFSIKRIDGTNAVMEQRRFARTIKNQPLYDNRTRAAISNIIRNYLQAERATNIELCDKKKAIKTLKKYLQRILIVDGKRLDPFKDNAWHYTIAFPRIMWLFWNGKNVINRIRPKHDN